MVSSKVIARGKLLALLSIAFGEARKSRGLCDTGWLAHGPREVYQAGAMANIEQNPAEERPFGAFAPKANLARIIAWTRAASDSFLGRKIAYALRRLGLRSLDGAPVDIESLGAKMRLYPSGNVCEKRVLFTPQYFDAVERELLASRLRDGFTFIDIGANIGAYSLFVAARAGRGARILAVEPQPEIFARLAFNIAQNPFGTVKAVACALADKPGELTLFIDPTNRGESSVRILNSSAGTSVKVPAMTLLSLVEGEGYDRIDAIKLDVEGAEDLILAGTLAEFHHHRGFAPALADRSRRPARAQWLQTRRPDAAQSGVRAQVGLSARRKHDRRAGIGA
jgi:FkbM family methyltransferase